jgi:hypothetical protein
MFGYISISEDAGSLLLVGWNYPFNYRRPSVRHLTVGSDSFQSRTLQRFSALKGAKLFVNL